MKLTFGKSGFAGKPTPEQKAILERLQAGELTPEQAAEALGGGAFTFEKKIALGSDRAAEAEKLDDLLGAGVEEAPPQPWGRMLGVALLAPIAVGAVMWLTGGTTTRSHLFTTALVAVAVFVVFTAVAGPGVARALPSGEAMNRIGVRAAVAAAAGVLAWGVAVTAGGHWSTFLPGVVTVLLGAGVLLVVLLGREAVYRGRRTMWLLRRRDRA